MKKPFLQFLYQQIRHFFHWFSTGADDWRERVFLALGRVLLVFSLPTLVSSLRLSASDGSWFIFWVYITAYCLLIILMLFPKLPFNTRVHGVHIFLFMLTVVSFLAHGLEGSGRIYLFFLVISTGLFLGIKAVLISLGISAFLFVFFGQLLSTGQISEEWGQTTSINIWIVTSLTFLAISSSISVALSVFVDFLEKSLNQEMVLTDNLKRVNHQLRVEIEEREAVQAAIQVQQEQFRAILDNFPEAVYVCHPQTFKIEFINRAFMEFLMRAGIAADDIYTKPCYQVLQGLESPCGYCSKDPKDLKRNQTHEWEYFNPLLHRHYQVTERLILWPGGDQMHLDVAIDITERKLAEKQLKHDALHDSLTGLPNRTLLMERLNHAILCSRRDPDCWFGLIFLDLDQFKMVNDAHGHSLGDQLLIEAAERLAKKIREVDMVARLGGDEFVVLLEHVNHEEDVYIVADRILDVLSMPYYFNGIPVIITASLGVFIGIAEELNPEEIIRDADIAMYQAKAKGRNQYVLFDQNMRQVIQQRSTLERDLRQAVQAGQFEVYYQPILRMEDSSIAGFEALVRWNHPEKEVLSPASFLRIAEELGLTVPMGYFVMAESIKQLNIWQQTLQCVPPLTLSINLSPKQLNADELLTYLKAKLKQFSIKPENINIEITEDLFMTQFEVVSEKLMDLRTLGVRIHLDDFGKEYSSLGRLQALPFDTLKIDRGFVKDFFIKDRGMEIVQTIVALAKGFKLETIAEGVETQEQLKWLKQIKCNYWQGYLFSPPVPAPEVENMLEINPPR